LRNNLFSQPESVTDAGSDLQIVIPKSTKHSRTRSSTEDSVVPPGPWMDVLNGSRYLLFIFGINFDIRCTDFLGQILNERSMHPVVVTVAPGHTVTVYRETNPETGQRILGKKPN
jgi:hypothetical protein